MKSSMKPVFASIFLGLAFAMPLSVSAQAVSKHSIATITHKDVAFLTEDILLSGSVGRTLKVAPLTSSAEGFGLGQFVKESPAIPFNTMPKVVVPNLVTQEQALSLARTWMQGGVNTLVSGFSGWLRERGISQGIYNFSQEIMVQTDAGPRKRAIAFNLSVDSKGRAVYGDPKVIDPDPLVLEAVYIPLHTSEDLPPDFRYPDAGSIRYRVLNKHYEPVSNWKAITLGGVYDGNENDFDTNAVVSCLMDNRYQGCTPAPLDINRLMNQVGASYALVAYVNRLQPVYEGPDDEQQAVTAISVEERNFTCSAYENKGSVGYLLAMTVDQYVAQSGTDILTYRHVGTSGTYGVSPVTPYQKTVPASALGGYHPDYFVISPYPNDNSLINRMDSEKMKNFVYIAPVVDASPPPNFTFSGNLEVSSSTLADGSRDLQFGTWSHNYLGGGVYEWSTSFNLSSPQALKEFTLTEAVYDDWLLIKVNGTAVFLGPYGGDMLELVSGATYIYPDATCNYANNLWTCGRYKITNPYKRICSEFGNCNRVFVPEATYTHCSYGNFGSFWDDMVGGYSCSNSPCAVGQVQYRSSGACGSPELRTVWHNNLNIDLTPYLKAGQNTITAKLVVAGTGQRWFRIRAKGCSDGMNLATTPPDPSVKPKKSFLRLLLENFAKNRSNGSR